MKQNEIMQKSILAAVGVEVYIFLIATIMNNGEKIFGKQDTVVLIVIMLMIFTLSAAVVGGLIVAKPIFLYIDGKKKEAVSLFISTIISVAVLTLLTGLIYVLVK